MRVEQNERSLGRDIADAPLGPAFPLDDFLHGALEEELVVDVGEVVDEPVDRALGKGHGRHGLVQDGGHVAQLRGIAEAGHGPGHRVVGREGDEGRPKALHEAQEAVAVEGLGQHEVKARVRPEEVLDLGVVEADLAVLEGPGLEQDELVEGPKGRGVLDVAEVDDLDEDVRVALAQVDVLVVGGVVELPGPGEEGDDGELVAALGELLQQRLEELEVAFALVGEGGEDFQLLGGICETGERFLRREKWELTPR